MDTINKISSLDEVHALNRMSMKQLDTAAANASTTELSLMELQAMAAIEQVRATYALAVVTAKLHEDMKHVTKEIKYAADQLNRISGRM
jgi:hypothetical protein